MSSGNGRVIDGRLRLLLGADEKNRSTLGDNVFDEVIRTVDLFESLTKIDDVDAIAFAEDVRFHLRIPAAGLMAEMDSGLQ